MPTIAKIDPKRPMSICTAPDEGSRSLKVCHVVFRGGFEDRVAEELVVGVADAVEIGLEAGGLAAGVVAAAIVEDEGPATGVGMVCRSTRQAAIRFGDWAIDLTILSNCFQ